MAPVAGPRGKAVPTPPAPFTPVLHRVIPVSQRRRGDSRTAKVQQQAGAAASIIVAPHSGSIESEGGRGNKSCSSSYSLAPDSSGGPTPGLCKMERRTNEQLSTCSEGSGRDFRDAGPGRKGREMDGRRSASCRGRNRDSRVADSSIKVHGAADHQIPASRSSRSSRSRVRQYRKRVCVRWGSLQWSLALVLVVRSAAGCQGADHHHAVATPRPLTVA